MNEAKATRYQRLRRRAQAFGRLAAGSVLAVFAFTPVGPLTWAAAASAAPRLPDPAAAGVALLLFVAVVLTACAAAVFPTCIRPVRRIDAAYGRSGDARRGAGLPAALFVLTATTAAAVVVLASARAAGAAWWLVSAAVIAAGVVVAGRYGPALLDRGAVRPLGRPELEGRISALAARAGVPVSSIQEWVDGETSSTIATITGVGASRRVLLSSEVAREWPDDEVTVIVAHELAHHVHRDVLRTMALDAVILAAGLLAADVVLGLLEGSVGLRGPGHPASLPAVAFVASAVWLAATPIRHAQSRRQERRADRWALARTGHAHAFSSAIRRASARRMADENPGLLTRVLYHRHPPVVERLELAARYLQEQQN